MKFLKKNNKGNLATSIGNQPYVRPFEYCFNNDKGIFFYTSDDKAVYDHLKSNPKMSFCSTDHKYDYVELIGEVKFSDDINYKKRVLKESKFAKDIYKTEDNPHLRVFYMDHGKALYHAHDHNDEHSVEF